MSTDFQTFLSKLAGVSLQIREAKPGLWVALPNNRAHLASKLWKTYMAGPSQGICKTADQAALLLALAAGETGPIRSTKQTIAADWLRGHLGSGMVIPVPWLKAQAKADGISLYALDRAAGSMGVRHEKSGLDGPWFWILP